MSLSRTSLIITACAVVALLTVSLLMWIDIRVSARISAAQLLTQIDTGRAPGLVDVRSASEYTRAHVPGARHAPFWSNALLLAAAGDAAGAPESLVVYCTLGPRASWAKWTLWLAGYRNVRLLEGHMAGWQDAGLRTATGSAPGL
jgi:rhodanese-related sulfurtransferase